jgi:hypothetical protein
MSDIVIELRGWPGSPARALHTMMKAADEITRLRAGLQKIAEGDGFWDAPSIARDLLAGKDVT